MPVPTLSAMTTNYNDCVYLKRAMAAVTGQSRPPDEYIIVDDGSTDDSVALIESYAKRFSFIKFIRNPSNLGFFTALSQARNLSGGDYIYGCSADDYPLPGFFENAMKMAADYPQAALITGQMIGKDSKGRNLFILGSSRWHKPLYAAPEVFLREYLEVESAGHCMGAATIYRHRALSAIGDFRARLGPLCDTFAIRVLGLKYGIGYLPVPCAAATIRPESMSHSALSDPSKMREYIRRTADLMRSRDFCVFFPAEYVKAWEASYLRIIRLYHHPCIKPLVRAAVCFTRWPVGRTLMPRIERILRRRFSVKKFVGSGNGA